MSSLRAGADLSHIFCTKDALIPIKSYSPGFIVHHILDSSPKEIIKRFPSLHSIVIVPGLGRDENSIPLVLIDALKEFFSNKNHEEIK